MRYYTRERVSMDLAKQAKIVDSIHDTLHDFVGQRLKVRANMGRSKIVESEGVLTGMVELSQNGEPLFEPFIEETPLTGMEKPEDLLEEKVLS